MLVRRRRWCITIAGILLLATVTGCGGQQHAAPAPRAVNAAEANELANVRFLNLTSGGARVAAQLGEGGSQLAITGWLDWKKELLYAEFRPPAKADPARTGLLQCTPGGLGIRSATQADAPPLPVPTDGWNYRAYSSTATVDLMCQLLLQLNSDRPDNASLLQQSGAYWLSQQRLGSATVNVIQGPGAAGQPAPAPGQGTIRYWIDTQNGKLLRLQAKLGATTAFSTFDFTYGTVPAIDTLPPLRAPASSSPSSGP